MRLERMSWKHCEEYFKDHDMVNTHNGGVPENHGNPQSIRNRYYDS